MHVVCVSYYYERFLTSPAELLERYPTLTQWADGLREAGARVSVVQRFGRNAEVWRNDVLYRFVHAPHLRFGSLADRALRVNQAVAALSPDIVHANGSGFARQTARLKTLLPHVPVVLQDHANRPPRRWLSRATLGRAMRAIDAVSFTVPQQMLPWQEAGIIAADKPILLLPEGTSAFCLQSRQEAREGTGLYGHPLCLWVGRLNANKDPLTVLQGFGRALACLPNALLVMVYSAADLLPQVKDWLRCHPHVAAHVILMGKVPHAALESLYNSADFFLLGSDYDGGSGYSVLEAMACGVVPLITDIPSFRAVTENGKFGGLWPVGDAASLARTLLDWYARLTPDTPQQMRDYFQANHSLAALGAQAIEAYGQLLQKNRLQNDMPQQQTLQKEGRV